MYVDVGWTLRSFIRAGEGVVRASSEVRGNGRKCWRRTVVPALSLRFVQLVLSRERLGFGWHIVSRECVI